MSELIQPADAEQQATRTRQRWSPRRVSRRGVIRLSAAGLPPRCWSPSRRAARSRRRPGRTTTAARNSGSGRVSQPAASKNTSTVSQVATTSAGSLVVTVRYRTGPKLRPTILSVSYSGGAKVHVKQPSLIFAFAPRFPLQVRTQPHSAAYYLKSPRPVRVIFFLVRLKAGQTRSLLRVAVRAGPQGPQHRPRPGPDPDREHDARALPASHPWPGQHPPGPAERDDPATPPRLTSRLGPRGPATRPSASLRPRSICFGYGWAPLNGQIAPESGPSVSKARWQRGGGSAAAEFGRGGVRRQRTSGARLR